MKNNKTAKEMTIYEQNMRNLLAELAEKGYTSVSLKEDKEYLDQITADILVPFLVHHQKNYCWGLMKAMQMTKMDGVGESTMKILDKLDYILSHEENARLPILQTIAQNHIYSMYRSHVRHKEDTVTKDDAFWDMMAATLVDTAETADSSETSYQTLLLMVEMIGSMKNLLVIIRLLSKVCGVKKEKLSFALQKYGDVAVAVALMERTIQKLHLPEDIFPLEKIRKRTPNFYLTLEPEKLEKKIDNATSYAKSGLCQAYRNKKKLLLEKQENEH